MIGDWNGYKNYNHYFEVGQPTGVKDFINEIIESAPKVIQHGKKFYWNIPCSFDIETTSFKSYGKKYATMYLWSLNINGSTLVGRTWQQFTKIIEEISTLLHTKSTALIIYVHNLGYEFQFMRGWFKWENVFASKERRPIYARLTNGIEFRCSYILSNYALAYIGDKLLLRYPVQKDYGSFDYSLQRNGLTHLTNEEFWYNVHDVQVVTSFIQEKIENDGGISEIPLTLTGYVRKYVREFCFSKNKKTRAKYKEGINCMVISSEQEYDMLQQAFAGGFTHCNAFYSGKVLYNLDVNDDEASEYPYELCAQKFPISRSILIGAVSEEELENAIKQGYCCLFTVKFKGLEPEFIYEHYISSSHCQVLSKDAVIDNGRVASASELQCTITEQDWDIIKRAYSWKNVEIHNLRVYHAGYLPKSFILAVLHLFSNKTKLKDLADQIVEYMVSKNMLNSTYGMAVTAIIRDIYIYSQTEGWKTEDANTAEQLESYNNNFNRFLFYAWGVWVTAYARHDLWDTIFELGPDYVYSDTDCAKGFNYEKHRAYFISANFKKIHKLKKMCAYYNIPFDFCAPKTKDGETKILGVWEHDPSYKTFKTDGAKRYIYELQNGELWFTVSGVNKKYGVPYLLHEFAGVDLDLAKLAYNPRFDQKEESKKAMEKIRSDRMNGVINYDQIFYEFGDGSYFPEQFTGKQTLTYIDETQVFRHTDYQGHTTTTLEYSCIYMEPQSYYMSKSADYIRFLAGIKDASI